MCSMRSPVTSPLLYLCSTSARTPTTCASCCCESHFQCTTISTAHVRIEKYVQQQQQQQWQAFCAGVPQLRWLRLSSLSDADLEVLCRCCPLLQYLWLDQPK